MKLTLNPFERTQLISLQGTGHQRLLELIHKVMDWQLQKGADWIKGDLKFSERMELLLFIPGQTDNKDRARRLARVREELDASPKEEIEFELDLDGNFNRQKDRITRIKLSKLEYEVFCEELKRPKERLEQILSMQEALELSEEEQQQLNIHYGRNGIMRWDETAEGVEKEIDLGKGFQILREQFQVLEMQKQFPTNTQSLDLWDKVMTAKEERRKISTEMSAQDAIKHITETPVEDLGDFLAHNESRKTVLDAYENKVKGQ